MNDPVQFKIPGTISGYELAKNTSAGTGLGLSLSYDIVKAHGGEIKVETNKNEGSSFIIKLYV